ncbi:ribonuclease H-like domain-containing protein [Halorubrum sp. Eb13]|uniref:ribonuclease H-like domain-containing protein n=1 Tax=Halorubrum sp. Eb13 TaxID=1383843 RepID=UPI000B997575|nr:ribonuclease H-like domain-containing protein [Halorubrum sp. Eb13]OYR49990.1 hypothetical protein DJ75_00610 [Halorubrum sp. Eb13]
MTDTLTSVSFDIETTGFERSEIVTTVGFSLPLGCRLFVNTADSSLAKGPVEERLETAFDTSIELSTHTTESALLESIIEFGSEILGPREYLLVAFNGETFRGGFDLPFLRSRFATHDVQWPFYDVPYADLMPIFNSRFNTTVEDSKISDLESVYEMLIGDGLTELDPFEDSSEAVTTFEEQRIEPLLKHNVSDVLRTDALATLAERYCSKSEFKLKSLTPVSHR